MGKTTNAALEWVEEMERRDADFKRRVDEELAAMRLEQQLIKLREARGLTQAQVARAIGVSQQAIAKAESGQAKNVELRTLLKHVLALGGRLEVSIRPGEETVIPGVGTFRLGPTHRKMNVAARKAGLSATTQRRVAKRRVAKR